jgi:hypothetical protein
MSPLTPENQELFVTRLLEVAQSQNVTLEDSARAFLLDAVRRLAATESASDVLIYKAEVFWSAQIAALAGQTLTISDIWKWLKKWLPDPVAADLRSDYNLDDD